MMKHLLKKLAREDNGQDMIEYALVAAIIGLGSLAILRSLSTNIGKVFGGLGNALTNALT